MENEKIKTSRASQTRAKTEKPKVWTPPSSLDAPPAPDGYRHRWIRAESMGSDDSKNVTGKLRSGWEFVRADEYPNEHYPSITSGKYEGVIGVGGLNLLTFRAVEPDFVKGIIAPASSCLAILLTAALIAFGIVLGK